MVEASRGLSAKFRYTNPFTKSPITIHIKDLFSIFSTSLESIGEYIGIGKLSLEGVGGKSENYWKHNMDELFKKHPDIFANYAVRDAQICFEAYIKVRQFFLEMYKVDILHFNTLPSIAGYIFRKDYLKESIAPTRTIELGINQKKKLADNQEKFYQIIQKQKIYDGDLNVRKTALFAYHGARVESYYRGRIEDAELSYYDIVSLYPSSATLQPLPCKDTSWFNLTGLKETNPDLHLELLYKGEGFCEVEFSFPESTNYPCLPVSAPRDNILYYPLNGVSWCTLSELRLALRLGLSDYKVLSGYAFFPSEKELNHPLKRYMEEMLENKNNSAKGSIEYELFKLLMNSLVGKYVQRDEDSINLELVEEGLLNREAYNKVSRRTAKSRIVGSLWNPEGAALILGKARAIISEFVNLGAYFVSTDSVLLPSAVDINCTALEELRNVGSDLKKEFDVSHGVLIRTRLYALNPFEEDRNKQHHARHGVHCSPDEFLEIMREGYTSKEIPELTYSVKKLTKYKESIRTGRKLNSEHFYSSSISLKFDGKRKLLEPVENPFAQGSWSLPLNSLEIKNNKRRKAVRVKADRKRGSKVVTEKKKVIIKMYQEGFTQTEICDELSLSKGYVSKVVKPLKEQGAAK